MTPDNAEREALKPCPFCGKNPYDVVQETASERRAIWCHSCTTWGPEHDTEDEAFRAWNRRVPDPDQASALSRLTAENARKDAEIAALQGEKETAFNEGRAFVAREILAALKSQKLVLDESVNGMVALATELGREQPISSRTPSRARAALLVPTAEGDR